MSSTISVLCSAAHLCPPVCVGGPWMENWAVLALQRYLCVAGSSLTGVRLYSCAPDGYSCLINDLCLNAGVLWWLGALSVVSLRYRNQKPRERIVCLMLPLCLRMLWSVLLQRDTVFLFQRSQTQSPTPPKPPSPSFELGLYNFPPLPGAAGHLKTEDLFENRLSSLLIGSSKERVRSIPLMLA